MTSRPKCCPRPGPRRFVLGLGLEYLSSTGWADGMKRLTGRCRRKVSGQLQERRAGGREFQMAHSRGDATEWTTDNFIYVYIIRRAAQVC